MVQEPDELSYPYDFVPFNRVRDVDKDAPPPHDRGPEADRLSGEISATLRVLTPLHIGSGFEELLDEADPPVVKTTLWSCGELVIPGMSLKGAIRSIFEAITPSCVAVSGASSVDRACRPSRGDDRLCPACGVFGALGYEGNVRFADARPSVDPETGEAQATARIVRLPQMWEPRGRSQLYTDDRGELKGRKFYRHGLLREGPIPVEVCVPNSRFDVRIGFGNITEAELGCLLLAMGAPRNGQRLRPKIGGFKPACCGSVQFSQLRVKTLPKDTWLRHDGTASALEPDEVRRLLAAAESLLADRGAAYSALAEILRYPDDPGELELCGYEEQPPH